MQKQIYANAVDLLKEFGSFVCHVEIAQFQLNNKVIDLIADCEKEKFTKMTINSFS